MKKERGQIALVMVFIIGVVAVLGAVAAQNVSVKETEFISLTTQAEAAKYAAISGVDELMYRLRSGQDFGEGFSVGLAFGNGATTSASISGDDEQKTITTTGYMGEIERSFEVVIASSSSKASFIFAVQSGDGGFELEGNTNIVGKDNTDGNVYSNGDLLGAKASSGQSGSKIQGNVWAYGTIGGIGNIDSEGVYVKKDAQASSLRACLVGEDVTAPLPPSNCPYSGSYTSGAGPEKVPLAAIDSEYWKDKAAEGGIFSGTCTIGSSGVSDCSNGTNKIGPLKIEGNLIVQSGKNLTFTGPVWVEGDLQVSQNVNLYTDDSLGTQSGVLVAADPSDIPNKGRIVTASNVIFHRNSSEAGLIMISENNSTNCTGFPAVDVTSNTATVVFVAENGCIRVGSHSILSGLLAYKIYIASNSTVEYDQSLAKAIVGAGTGGWKVVSFREY